MSNFLLLRRNIITSLKHRPPFQQIMMPFHHQDIMVNRYYYYHHLHHHRHRGGQLSLLSTITVKNNVNSSFPTHSCWSSSLSSSRYFSAKKPTTTTTTTTKKIIQASNVSVKKTVVANDVPPPPAPPSCIITTTLPDHLSRGPFYDKLAAWYQQHHQYLLDPFSERWTIQQHQHSPFCWTVKWTCPITNFQFTSGTLRKHPQYADAATAAVLVSSGGGAIDSTANGGGGGGGGGGDDFVVAYPSLELALEATCGHALDVLRFQQTGMLEPRRCRENPKEALLSLTGKSTPTGATTATMLPKWKRTMPIVVPSSSTSTAFTTIEASQVEATEKTVTTTIPPKQIEPELPGATVVTTREEQQAELPPVSAKESTATSEQIELPLVQSSTTSTDTPKKKKKLKKVVSSVNEEVAKKKKKKKKTPTESVTTQPPTVDKEQSLNGIPSTQQNKGEGEQVYNLIDTTTTTTLSLSTSASTAPLIPTTTTPEERAQLVLPPPSKEESPTIITTPDQEFDIKMSSGIASFFPTESGTKFQRQVERRSSLRKRTRKTKEKVEQNQLSSLATPTDSSSVPLTVQPNDMRPQQQLQATTTISPLPPAQPTEPPEDLDWLFFATADNTSTVPTEEAIESQLQQGPMPSSTVEPKQQAIEAEAGEDYLSESVIELSSDSAAMSPTEAPTAFQQQSHQLPVLPSSASTVLNSSKPQSAHNKTAEELNKEKKDHRPVVETSAAMDFMDSLIASRKSSDVVAPQNKGYNQQEHQAPTSGDSRPLFANTLPDQLQQQKTPPLTKRAPKTVSPNRNEGDRMLDVVEPSSDTALLSPATKPTELLMQEQGPSFLSSYEDYKHQLVAQSLLTITEISSPTVAPIESQQSAAAVAAANTEPEAEGDDGDLPIGILSEPSFQLTSTDDVETEEEYSIQLKPRRASTLGRIMEAWVDDFNFQPESSKQSTISSRLPMDEYPVQLENIVDRVQGWLRTIPSDPSPPSIRTRAENNRYNKTEEEYAVTFTTAFESHRLLFDSKAANRALSALAAVTSDRRVNKLEASSQLEKQVEEVFWTRLEKEGEDPASRREQIATQVLEKMWTCATDSNDRPTVETYNSYLKCLHGSSAQDAAKQASKILNLMQSGEKDECGRKLPLHDCGTLNAVLYLWAQVSDQATRREGIQGVYERLVEGEGKATVIPNRDTFITILSSEAEDGLDPDYACKWIDRMQKLSHEHPSLQPNSEVWNAPLRWSGDAIAANRPSSPWDKHWKIYQSGFRSDDSDDHPHNKEARDVEAWLDRMRGTDSALPTIETFESLIQAWIRTGTRQGLKQAESVAELTLESSQLTPRLSTFHPIVAAWATSGDGEGPDKVEEWINKLQSKGGQCMPDGRLRTAYIQALASLQQTKLTAMENQSDQLAQKVLADEVKDIAKKCSQSLEVLCAEIGLKDTDIMLEAPVFQQVMLAWLRSMAAYDRVGGNTFECIDEGVEELVQTVKRLDALIFKLQTQHGTDMSPASDQQRRHLMLTAGIVLDCFLDSMITLDRYRQKLPEWDRSDTLLLRHLSQIEKFIRRFDEVRQIYFKTDGRVESFGRKQPADQFLIYRDHYYYHVPQLWRLPRRSYIYSRFFANFELITPPPLSGDLIRISLQVAERAKTWEEIHQVGMDKMLRSQVKLLERLIPNKDEVRRIESLVDCNLRTIPHVSTATRKATAKAAAGTPSKKWPVPVNGSRQHRPRARSSNR